MNFEFWILDFLLFASSTYIRTMYSSGSVIVAAEVLPFAGELPSSLT
jgi:hypothetical protein